MKTQCPFCQVADTDKIIENEFAYTRYDIFPVSAGHCLIISKRHTANWFDLNTTEQSACLELLNKTKVLISKKFNPDGFNIGINIGESAGQTINHVHIHLIPRYNGDLENPRGGVRGVIPSKKDY